MEVPISGVPAGMFTAGKGGMTDEVGEHTIKVEECVFRVYFRWRQGSVVRCNIELKSSEYISRENTFKEVIMDWSGTMD
jgi:hypothetical protein